MLLHIPAGMSNTYTYDIPRTCRKGRTGITATFKADGAADYFGLAGCSRSAAPTATCRSSRKTHPHAQHGASVQLRVRPRGRSRQLNNYTWPQLVSTLTPPKADELANGTYRPLLAPVNFNQSKPGAQYFTVWYAGPLSIHNNRGRTQFIPAI